jgi:hypothetical protein
MSPVVDDILVNGSPLRARFREQVISGGINLSARGLTAFDFTVLDVPAMPLTREAADMFKDGTTIVWDKYALSVNEFTTGGGAQAPTIQVSAISDFVRALKNQTGGKNWGDTSVASWAGGIIRAAGAQGHVQAGLGNRPIERKEPEGNGTTDENTWDVMVEMAKQTGSWVFEYENRIVMGKPSWLISQPGVRRYQIFWNSWTDHTDALTAAPAYSWNKDKKEYEGRVSLTIKAIDPGQGSINPLAMCRPGDVIEYTGNAAVSRDPTWLVVSVNHPLIPTLPVTITAWRAIDPPEIIPKQENGEGSDGAGGDGAGVPNGPIGTFGWQGEQLKNATEIVKEAQRRGLPTLAAELAVATAMGESSLRNIGYGDAAGPDSTGLFQQRDSWGSRSDRQTPSKAAGFFLVALTSTPYQNNYNNGANSLSVSNVGSIYIGPGKSANAASVTIHRVQVNADPYHYVKFWGDAQKVVAAVIAAGKSSGGSGPALSGPLGTKITNSMKSMEGKYIEFDGAFMNQCVDVAKKYVADLTGIRNAMGNGNQWWMNPALSGTFTPISVNSPPRKGDLVSWSGSHGAYPNGGVGHVAVYSHSQGGTDYYLSQNPGPARIQPLSRLGVQGWMRPKG